MAGIYPQDLAKALLASESGGANLASLQKALTNWQTLAGSMQSRMDGTGDKGNPALLDHVLALQEPSGHDTWSGAAADSFLNNIKNVWSFGYDVRGQLQPTVWSSTEDPTYSWADIVDTMHTALSTAQQRYKQVDDGYNTWINDVASNVNSFAGSYDELNGPKIVPAKSGPNGPPGYKIWWMGLTQPDNYQITTDDGETITANKNDLQNPDTLKANLKTKYYQQEFDDILANLSTTYDMVREQVPPPTSTKDLPKVDPGNPNPQNLPTNPGANLPTGPGTSGLDPSKLGGGAPSPSGLNPGALGPGSITPNSKLPAGTHAASLNTNPLDGLSPNPSALNGAQPGATGPSSPANGLGGADTSGLNTDPLTSLAGYNPGGLDSSGLGLSPAGSGGISGLNAPALGGGSGLSGLGLSPAGGLPGLGGGPGSTSGLNTGALGGVGGLGGLGAAGTGSSTGRGASGEGAAEEVGAGTGASPTAARNGAALAGETAAAEGATVAGGRMPYMPPMSPMGMGNNAQDRQRKAWLPDDEDVWGVQTSAVPGVLDGN